MAPTDSSDNPGDEVPRTCSRCQGRGWVDQSGIASEQFNVCEYCNGKGVSASGSECYGCHGTGHIEIRLAEKYPCPKCGGAGIHPVPESMTYGEFAFKPGRG